MSDDVTSYAGSATTVPELGVASAQAPERTEFVMASGETASQTQTAASPRLPEEPRPQAPAGLTREDVDALLSERLSTLEGIFATRQDVERAAQSASDKRYAKLMRDLAPELRGIDKAVQLGTLDAAQARTAKQELLLQAAAKMDQDDAPSAAASGGYATESYGAESYGAGSYGAVAVPHPPMDWNALGQKAIRNAGLTMADFPELSQGPVSYDKLLNLIVEKKTAKVKTQETEPLRQEIEKLKQNIAVLTAEKNGGVTPPPEGGASGSADHELQTKLKALRGSGRVAEAMALIREAEAKRK